MTSDMKLFFKKNRPNLEGFTLLDIIVGVAIFTAVTLSSTAIFQQVIKGQRHAIAAQNTQESVRYAFEVMSKEIRNAQIDNGTCITSGQVYELKAGALYFKNQFGECVVYALVNARLQITRTGSIAAFITPDEVVVSRLNFDIKPIGLDKQSAVTIIMGLYNTAFGDIDIYKSQIDLQTTISSRSYE